MKLSSFIKGSMAQFRVNLVRTLLALLGIIFGVASVIAMITIGEGAQQEILDNINAMGADLVHIQEGDLDKTQLSQLINDSLGLSLRDVRALQAALPMAGRDLAYFAKCRIKVTNLAVQASELNAFATSDNFVRVNRLAIKHGRDLHPADFRARAAVAIISEKLATALFRTPAQAIDQAIRLNYCWVRIVGVFAKAGPPTRRGGARKGFPKDYGILDRSILLPLTTVQDKLASERIYSPLDKILVQGRDIGETNALKLAAERILAAAHNNVRDYKIISPQELLDQQQSTQEIFNIVLLSIASISLLVGGIGIMNIMLANVLERRTEIGIRRALGAKRRHIVLQFMFESVTICLIGGLLGIALGLAIGLGIAHLTKIPVAFTLEPILISFAIAFAVGVLFGIVPAREAANLNPVEALHDE